jgi:hypothetical protein
MMPRPVILHCVVAWRRVVSENMSTTREAGRADTRSAAKAPPSTRDRPGLRITLLSLAVAILLLGAAVASVYGYAAYSGRGGL